MAKPIIEINNLKPRSFQKKGFTLVEMLVSLFIFSAAMGIAGQLFFYSLKMQRQMVAHNKLISELSYSMERVSRGLRMAQKDDNGTCIGSYENYEKGNNSYGDRIKFMAPDTSFASNTQFDCIEYYLDHPDDYPDGVVALIESRHNEGGAFSDFVLPLTSPEVNVQSFSVVGLGWAQNDDYDQPRVILHIKAIDSQGKDLEIQMAVSQRNIDIRY